MPALTRHKPRYDNDKLRGEGKTDQTIGEVNQVADRVVDNVKRAAKSVHESICRRGASWIW